MGKIITNVRYAKYGQMALEAKCQEDPSMEGEEIFASFVDRVRGRVRFPSLKVRVMVRLSPLSDPDL